MEKWAIIRNGKKGTKGLHRRSLIQVIRELRQEGYQVYDERN